MMKAILTNLIICVSTYSFICAGATNDFNIQIKNPNNFSLIDAFIEIEVENVNQSFLIKNNNDVIPYQVFTNEGGIKSICLVLNLNANEEKTLTVLFIDEKEKPNYLSRTYAELAMKLGNIYYDGKFRGNSFVNVTKLKVPGIHTDHDALFKYEGPGWESEKVGYRYYLDWRNAIDIFGKKKDQLILANVGIYDTVAKDDSYHLMQDWGMDIFKVGSSLGIGSLGMWQDGKVNMVSKTDSVYCEITKNGPIKSEIKTNYFGWQVGDNKFNLQTTLSITAGSRFTKNEIEISNNPKNIVTGIAKYGGTEFFKSNLSGEWSYIALYGDQTLVSDNDKLGLAIFYRSEDFIDLAEDNLSYIIKLKPENVKTHYFFCAAWEQEENGIKNIKQFKEYLFQTQQLLNNPIIVTIERSGK